MKVLIIQTPYKLGKQTVEAVLSGYLHDVDHPHHVHMLPKNIIGNLKSAWQKYEDRYLVYNGEYHNYFDLPIYKYGYDNDGNYVLKYSLTETDKYFVVDHTNKPVGWVSVNIRDIYSFNQFLERTLDLKVISKDALKKMVNVPENYILSYGVDKYRIVGNVKRRSFMMDWDYMTVDEVMNNCTGPLKPTSYIKPAPFRPLGPNFLNNFFRRDDDDDDADRMGDFGARPSGPSGPTKVDIPVPPGTDLAINMHGSLFLGCKHKAKLEKEARLNFFKFLFPDKGKVADLKNLLESLFVDITKFREDYILKRKDGKEWKYKDLLKVLKDYPNAKDMVDRLTKHGYVTESDYGLNLVPFMRTAVSIGVHGDIVYDTHAYVTKINGIYSIVRGLDPYKSVGIGNWFTSNIVGAREAGTYYTFIKYT